MMAAACNHCWIAGCKDTLFIRQHTAHDGKQQMLEISAHNGSSLQSLLDSRLHGHALHQAAHCTQRQTANVGILNAHDGSSLQSLLDSGLQGHALHQAAHCTQRQTAHVGIVNAHDGSSLQSLLESKLHGHTLQQAAHCTQRQSARLLTVGSMSAQWKQLALTAGQKVGYSLLDRRLVTPCQAAHCTK